MIVCLCRRLNETAVREAARAGAQDPDAVQAFHGETFNCGKCRYAMADILDDEFEAGSAALGLVPAE